MVAVLMGVTGSGKTTVGHALAKRTGWSFADADDFHSPANRAKMHSGIPLTDADREPWLESLHEQIQDWLQHGQNAVLACSALRESYRNALVAGTPKGAVCFVYLHGPAAVIHDRLEARRGHYMPPALLGSQLAALEPPADGIPISIAQSVPAIVEQIMNALAREGYAEGSSS